MKKTTLCYIERQGKYLMLFRNKKEADPNEGKYVGVGGKFLPEETPQDCLLREVFEETGFKLTSYRYRGLVHFVNDTWEDEDMYLFTADGFEAGEKGSTCDFPVPECNEGTFEWVPIANVESLRLWEGDRYFLRKLAAGCDDIHMTLSYEGDSLVSIAEH